jgi:hypothetical protein
MTIQMWLRLAHPAPAKIPRRVCRPGSRATVKEALGTASLQNAYLDTFPYHPIPFLPFFKFFRNPADHFS